MTDKKISQLPSATTPLSGGEILPAVQGTATVKVPVTALTNAQALTPASVNIGSTLGTNKLAVGGTVYVSGAVTASSLALNGATLGSNTLAVTGSASISSGVTADTAAIGGATLGSNDLAVAGSADFGSPVTFSTGSAVDPSITHAGDTGTGFYFATSSGLRMTTGGVTAAYVSSGQCLGVGVAPDDMYRVDIVPPGSGGVMRATRGTSQLVFYQINNGAVFNGTESSNDYNIITSGAVRMNYAAAGNVYVGPVSGVVMATAATDGFFGITVCSGAPTGTPTDNTNRAPMVFDKANLRLYAYLSGVWRYATFT